MMATMPMAMPAMALTGNEGPWGSEGCVLALGVVASEVEVEEMEEIWSEEAVEETWWEEVEGSVEEGSALVMSHTGDSAQMVSAGQILRQA